MIQKPVVILANGDFPTHKIPLLKLEESGTIICCDGSVNNLVKNGLEPHYILGDLDSVNDDLKNKYSEQVIELSDQDENDLRKAIQWVEGQGVKKAVILGATGMRDDHNIANIFSLLQFPSLLEITMYTNHGVFSVVKGKQKFDSFIGQQVSVFSANPNIEVTSTCLKYNLNNNNLNNIYCGSLNESIERNFSISISHGKILVYQVF